MMPHKTSSLLSLAVQAAKKSAEVLLRDHAANRIVDLSTKRDIKIAADKRSEKVIADILLRGAPYSVLSEERGCIRNKKDRQQQIRWIVDPLDGSLNYYRGIPLGCVSIALWDGETPILGVIYDFNRKECFAGVVGGEARLNGKIIKVSTVSKKSDAVLCTGFPSATDFSAPVLKGFVQDIRTYKKVRLLGSAALSLAYVACGRVDVYRENNIHLWDVAAGIAIVKSANGTCAYAHAGKKHQYNVSATNTLQVVDKL
jgi:fructose-1,6-bisphosphatase/inositol monophosphatase family enzyme